jgi:hypothetical protein
MKKKLLLLALLGIVTGVSSMEAPESGGFTVVTYPAIPGLATSDLFSVNVNGREIWTEKFRTGMDTNKLPDWFLVPYTRVPQEIHQASFACNGKLEVSVRVPHTIKRASIHPITRGIRQVLNGNVLRFWLPGPDKIYVQIDNLPQLFIFASPIEQENISPNTPGVHYFGPGAHRPGYISLKDSETVYIAGGAVVYGGIRAKGVHNIRVIGRGILDGKFEFEQMVLLEDCKDVLFEGVMIRNGAGWTNTIVNSERVRYDNVNVLSFGPSGDGIDPLGSKHVVISNCFLRCTDDCIAIKAPARNHGVSDILVSDNTMFGFAFSDGVTIGFETNANSLSNITVRNCDVLLARGGSRVDGHSGFSIICDGPAVIHDVLFDDIRVEKAENKLFELQVTNGKKYGVGPPGHITDITLRNISWAHTGLIVLKGYDGDHAVNNVTFENCTVAGKPLADVKSTVMQIGSFVDSVTVR